MKEKVTKKILTTLLAIAMICTMILMTGCRNTKDKITDKSIIAKIDGSEITLEEARFYMYLQQANYEAYYLSNGQEIDWSSEYKDDEGNTVSVQDEVKISCMDILYKQRLFAKKAAEWGINLDESDTEEVDKLVKEFMTDSDKDLLKKIGSNETIVRKMYEDVQLYSKVCDKLFEDNPITVTDEEAKQGLFTIAIIDSSSTDSPKETADAVLQRVKSGENITYVADKYALETSTGNVGKGDMNNELENVCLSLKKGESDIAIVDSYYYVVYCDKDYDEDATKIAKEQLTAEKKNDYIEEYYNNLKKDAQIELFEKVFDSVKFTDHLFTKDDMETTTETTTTGNDKTENTTAAGDKSEKTTTAEETTEKSSDK